MTIDTTTAIDSKIMHLKNILDMLKDSIITSKCEMKVLEIP